jgi:predicted DsbA family dithiol-disulfide isomerase
MKALAVDIWSDVACPWCWVGKRRFEKAVEAFPHRDELRVTWHSFELDPSAPPIVDTSRTYAERLARKYGTSIDRAGAMIRQMTNTGLDEGLEFHFEKIRPGNTFDAHRLIHFAGARNRGDAARDRLFRAYFGEGSPIGDRETLIDLAGDIDLDRDEVRGALAGDAYAREVRDDEARAHELGIHGVPFFVFGGRYGVSGAQLPDVLRDVLTRSWNELGERADVGPAAR